MPSTNPTRGRGIEEPGGPVDERDVSADEPTDPDAEQGEQAEAEDTQAEDTTDGSEADDEAADHEADPASTPRGGILRGPLVLALMLSFVALRRYAIRPR